MYIIIPSYKVNEFIDYMTYFMYDNEKVITISNNDEFSKVSSGFYDVINTSDKQLNLNGVVLESGESVNGFYKKSNGLYVVDKVELKRSKFEPSSCSFYYRGLNFEDFKNNVAPNMIIKYLNSDSSFVTMDVNEFETKGINKFSMCPK